MGQGMGEREIWGESGKGGEGEEERGSIKVCDKT